jgi:hypothetical protein
MGWRHGKDGDLQRMGSRHCLDLLKEVEVAFRWVEGRGRWHDSEHGAT